MKTSFTDVSTYLTTLKVNGYRYEIPSLDLMAAFMTRPIFRMNRAIMIRMNRTISQRENVIWKLSASFP